MGFNSAFKGLKKQVRAHELDLNGYYDWKMRPTAYIYIYIYMELILSGG